MSVQGYFIVFGTIGLILALLIGGYFMDGPAADTLIPLGIGGAVLAVCFVIWFFIQLNSSQ